MNQLQQIIEHKRGEVQSLLPHCAELREKALLRSEFRSFQHALQHGKGNLTLIAEVKRASPSAGMICENFSPVEIALAYQAAGAHAISVLTDKKFFQGSLDDLVQVRNAVKLPVLRKDFIIDEAQIYQSACAGADAILLIVAALAQERLKHLLDIAKTCQLDALVEVHDSNEMARALDAKAGMIGINNRNLKNFTVDLAATERLSKEALGKAILVSESGIKSGTDSHRVFLAGARAILVGETLMRSDDVATTIRELLTFQKCCNATEHLKKDV